MVTAAAVLVVVVVVMVTAAAVLVVVVVVMVAAAAVLVVVVIVMVVRFLSQRGQFGRQLRATLHGSQDLLAVQCVPRGGHDGGFGVVQAQQRYAGGQFFLATRVGAAEQNGARVGHLIVEKLAEILHIHLAFAGVDHRDGAARHRVLHGGVLHGGDDIAQLADTRRLDEHAVGVVLFNDLAQCFSKIAHKAAADAARIELVDRDAGLLHKAAVDADLTEFVFDKHQLLALVRFGDQLFDERGLAGTQKAGEYIDLRHNKTPFFSDSSDSIPFLRPFCKRKSRKRAVYGQKSVQRSLLFRKLWYTISCVSAPFQRAAQSIS